MFEDWKAFHRTLRTDPADFELVDVPREHLRTAALQALVTQGKQPFLVDPPSWCPTWASVASCRELAPSRWRGNTVIVGTSDEDRFHLQYALAEADAVVGKQTVVVDTKLGARLKHVDARFRYRTYSDRQLAHLLDTDSGDRGHVAIHLSGLELGVAYVSRSIVRLIDRPNQPTITVAWKPAHVPTSSSLNVGADVDELVLFASAEAGLVIPSPDTKSFLDYETRRRRPRLAFMMSDLLRSGLPTAVAEGGAAAPRGG